MSNSAPFEIESSLPDRFDFYHLGEVYRTDTPPQEYADFDSNTATFLTYRLEGERRVVMVLKLPSHLDVSTYMELGNILASQLSNQLSQKGVLTLPSPPKIISQEQFHRLFQQPPSFQKFYYLHHTENQSIPIETLLWTAEEFTHV